jgi:hypothetical protein
MRKKLKVVPPKNDKATATKPKKKKLKIVGTMPSEEKKKAPKKKLKIVEPTKKKTPPKKKKLKIVGTVEKPKPKKTPGEKMTGKTTAQMKAEDPLKLFGALPQELRKKVLTSGVKVGTYKPIREDFRRDLEVLIDNAYYKDRLRNEYDSWSMYEGGNFGQNISDYFERQRDRLQKGGTIQDKGSYDAASVLMEAIADPDVYGSIRQMKGSDIASYFKTAEEEGGFYGDVFGDPTDYFQSDNFNLIYEDDDYYVSNRTRSAVRDYTTRRIKELDEDKPIIKRVLKNLRKKDYY